MEEKLKYGNRTRRIKKMIKDWFHFWLPISLGTFIVGVVLSLFSRLWGGYIMGVAFGMITVNLVGLEKED